MGKHIHRLSNIDPIARVAVCACCGPVDILYRSSKSTWICRDAIRERRRKYRKDHPRDRGHGGDPVRKLQRHNERSREIRLEAIQHYGGKCAFCGDSNPHHLVFDHINNDGAKQRREAGYSLSARWLKSHGFPDDIQILCQNHNSEKAIYGTMTI